VAAARLAAQVAAAVLAPRGTTIAPVGHRAALILTPIALADFDYRYRCRPPRSLPGGRLAFAPRRAAPRGPGGRRSPVESTVPDQVA